MDVNAKKIDNNTILYHDSLTNDPIAIAKVTKQSYSSKKNYSISWHPDARLMHPATNDLGHMNFDSADSQESALNKVSNKYSQILDNKDRAPLKVVHVGTSTKKIGDLDMQYDDFHLHSEDDKHVATIHVKSDATKYIGTSSKSLFDNPNTAFLAFHGEQPSPEKFEISQKKYSGADPVSMMHQVKHWMDTKDKEPSFVGLHSTKHEKSFRTSLSPENASSKYFDHMHNNKTFIGHDFKRISPTMFTATQEPDGRYSIGSHEIVDTSTPGVVKHYSIPKHHTDDTYNVKPNREVIE